MNENQGNFPQFNEYEKGLLLDGGWYCTFCNRVNADYVSSCACGHSKRDSELNQLGLYTEPAENTTVSSVAAFANEQEVAVAVETEPVAAQEPVALEEVPEHKNQKAVSKFIYPDTELDEYEQGIIDDGGWQCGFCRRINASYVTSCACEHNKDDSDLKHLGLYVDLEEEYYDDEDEYDETETPFAVEAESEPVVESVPVQQVAPVPQQVQPVVAAQQVAPAPQAINENVAKDNSDSPFVDFTVPQTTPAPQTAQVQQNAPIQQNVPVQPAAYASQATPAPQVAPTPQEVPVQSVTSAPQTATVDAAAQNSATLKANLEQQIMEDLKKNNYSDASVVRANRKYREMVKKGIMTQEECNAKMHELLPMEEAEDSLDLEREDSME